MKLIKISRIAAHAFSLVLLSPALFCMPVQASQSTINSLFIFACDSNGNCAKGNLPNSLIQSADGNFYGTTEFGGIGSQARGTVFKLTSNGQLTTLFTFVNDQNGAEPSSLIEGNDGFLYGLTTLTNNNGNGLFRLSKAGEIKLISSNLGQNAFNLLLADDGNFYFCTLGANPTPGQVLRVTASGVVTSIHTFNLSTEGPGCGGILLGGDGNLYGTTLGAQTLHTTVFRLTPAGSFTILHTINYSEFPVSLPTQTADGRIWAVVSHISGTLQPAMFAVGPSGANYQETPLFYNQNSGLGPFVSFLSQPSDGKFWGIFGTDVVSFTLKGALLQQIPYNGTGSPVTLLQASNGTLVGVATGLALGEGPGEIFTIDPALSAPVPLFVHSKQSTGKIGSQVMIQGSHFVGATAVTFNGVSASFQVLNTGNILATVPASATTGRISVTNAGGTTESRSNFVVE